MKTLIPASIAVAIVFCFESPDLAAAATITVTSTNDSGSGSLRQAIEYAAFGDTINFAVTGIITLTNGQLLVTSNLVITGPGATNLMISGNDASRVFEIVSNITVTLAGLTIANGRNTNGGGIYNAGSLALLQCALVTNAAFGSNTSEFADPAGTGCGGGVYNSGSLKICNTLFQKNLARGGSVNSPTGQSGGSGFGGAICNARILFITASTFADNAAHGGGGGLGANASYFSGAIPGGTGGTANGGAIYCAAQNVYITNSTFGGNTATGGNGGTGGNGLFGYCHTFPGDPRATRGAEGGAGGGGYGGALCSSDGFTRIFSSTFSGNTAFAGSGGAGGTGGICFEGDGSASSGDSGFPGYAVGGGINSSNTITQSTILADNRVTSSLSAFQDGPDVTGSVGSLGHNLIGITNGSNGWIASDWTGTSATPLDAKLGPLQNSGGPTFTMALLPGSPAIDQGSSGVATTDQRGRPRVYDDPAITNAVGGDGSDIGAFEFNPPVLSIARAADNLLMSWPAYDTGYTLEATTNLSPSINWSKVADTPAIVAGQFTVTNSATTGNKFYRLKSQ